MKKYLAAVLCVGVLMGMSVAPAQAKFKDTITMVNELEPDTLDPRRGNGISNNIVMTLIYDSLVDLDREGKEIPRLATSWEFIDSTHLRMHLRHDVVFSNGYPLTAEDVLFSLARTKDDSTSFSTMIWAPFRVSVLMTIGALRLIVMFLMSSGTEIVVMT